MIALQFCLNKNNYNRFFNRKSLFIILSIIYPYIVHAKKVKWYKFIFLVKSSIIAIWLLFQTLLKLTPNKCKSAQVENWLYELKINCSLRIHFEISYINVKAIELCSSLACLDLETLLENDAVSCLIFLAFFSDVNVLIRWYIFMQ